MNTKLRQSLFLLFTLLFSQQIFAQITGTKNVPGDYATLADAITALNMQGVGAGGATINILPGNPEVAPAGGYVLGTTTLNASTAASKPLIINGNGNTITANEGNGSIDGIFFIQGTDYVTIDGLNLLDTTTAASTDVKRMEFGYAFVKLNPTAPFDGCQFNVIKNCKISLAVANTTVNVGGIYAGNHVYNNTTQLLLTQATDANSNNTFMNDSVMNARRCIALNGYNDPDHVLYDRNNKIGGDNSNQGNTIVNFGALGGVTSGNGATLMIGVYLSKQTEVVVQNNYVNDSVAGGRMNTGITYGIYDSSTINGTFTCTNNTVELAINNTGGLLVGIYSAVKGADASSTISNNILQNFSSTVGNTASTLFIQQAAVAGTVSITNNHILNSTINKNGTSSHIYGIRIENGVAGINGTDTFSNVTVTGNEMNNIANKAGSNSGMGILAFNSFTAFPRIHGRVIISNNTVSNLTSSSTGTSGSAYGFYSETGGGNSDIAQSFLYENNTVSGITANSTIAGIIINSGDTVVIRNNTFHDFSSSSASSVTSGINVGRAAAGASNSSQAYVYGNKIYDLANTNTTVSAAVVAGIQTNGGLNYVFNNMISDLRSATTSTTFSGAYPAPIVGISLRGLLSQVNGKKNYVYYNTINIGGATGLPAGTGATGIQYYTGDTNTIENNIVYVNTVAGTNNNAAVIRRETTADNSKKIGVPVANVTPSDTGFTSNNNIYYIPAGSNNYYYVEHATTTLGTITNSTAVNGFGPGGLTSSLANNIWNDPQFNTGCSLYKQFIKGQDNQTFWENNLPQIGSTNTFAPSGSSYAKASSIPVATPPITTDFNNVSRGATPDRGALQFTGTTLAAGAPPVITYSTLPTVTTYCVSNVATVTAKITAPGGLNVATNTKPRLYYKKQADNNAFGNYPTDNISTFNGWKYVEGTGTAPNFSFAIDYTKLTTGNAAPGDSIMYFLIAQDLSGTPVVGANVNFTAGCALTSVNIPASVNGVSGTSPLKGYRIMTVPSPWKTSSLTLDTVCTSGYVYVKSDTTLPGTISVQWQQDNNTGNWVDIPSATTFSYTSPAAITSSNNYRMQVRCLNGSSVGTSTVSSLGVVPSPTVTSTIPAGNCGNGTVDLSATSSKGGSIAWYAAASGGEPLATGNNYTTPVLATTTPFYASSYIGTPRTHVGLATWNPDVTSSSLYGIRFDALQAFTLHSFVLYARRSSGTTTSTANVTITLNNSAGTVLQSKVVNVSVSSNVKTAIPVTVDWPVPAGTDTRICISNITYTTTPASGIVFQYQTNVTYPYGVPGIVQMKDGVTSAGALLGNTYYPYFYDWVVSAGCESSPRTLVNATIAQPTTLSANTGTPTVCVNDATQLFNTQAGGTWSSDNTGIATVNSANGVVTGVAAGTANITYTYVNGPCTATKSTLVTVNAQPAITPITNTPPTCMNGTVTLTTATPGGKWTSNSTGVATVDLNSGLVTAVGAGTANITYTVTGANTCTNTVSTGNFTVYALPNAGTVNGTGPKCIGSTANLTNGTGGGTWSSSDINVATVNSTGLVTAKGAGTANIIYTVTDAHCSNKTTSANFTVYTLPNVGPITGTLGLCTGQGSTTLTAAPAGGSWASSNAFVASILPATGVMTPQGAGKAEITYTYTDGNGCTNVAFDTARITATPAAPTITGGNLACMGSTLALGSNTPGGSWGSSNPTAATISATTGVVTPVGTGATTITYNVNTGCATSNTMTLSVNNKPGVQAITGNAPKCVGSTATLGNSTVTTGGTVTWKSDNTAIATVNSSGLVTAVAPGTAKITYVFTNSNTCTDSVNTGTFTVYAKPTVNAITGTPASLCVGSTAQLANNTTGGTGAWSSSASGVAGVSSTGLVTGASGGSVAITYTFTDINTCVNSVTTPSFTVYALPAVNPITGAPSLLCAGNTVQLNTTSTGGAWSSNSNPTATINTTGLVTGVAAGNVVFTYSIVTNGCTGTASTASIPVYLKPNVPNVSGALAVCTGAGATTTLTGAPTGGSWLANTPSLATVNSTGTVTGVAAGTANFTYTVTTNGCSSATNYNMTVNTSPAAPSITGTNTLCTGNTTTLIGTPGGGAWSSNNTTAAPINTNTGQMAAQQAGNATITYIYTDGNSCSSSNTYNVTINAKPATPTVSGINTMCEGGSVTLNTSGTGGTWGSSNTTAAPVTSGGVVSGSSAGGANITYAVTANGCTSTGSLLVTVNPKPAIPGPITGGPVCEGSTAQLSSTTTGGTWVSGSINRATIDATTGMATGVAAGTSIITYTVTNVYSCSNAITSTLTVNARPSAPQAITGTLAVCDNGTTQLNSTTAGGTWSSDNTAMATVDVNGLVSGVGAGTATIKYTVTNSNNCTNDATAQVTINPHPDAQVSAGGPKSFCEGDSVVFTSTTQGTGLTYQWLDVNPIIGATQNTYTALTSGTYQLEVTDGNGCLDTAAVDTVVVFIIPTPVVTHTPTTVNTASGYASYQWFVDGVQISGANSSSYTMQRNGTYAVVVTDSNGCSKRSNDEVVTDYVGIGTIIRGSADVSIYPNPAMDVVKVSAPVSVTITVCAIDGKELIKATNAKEVSISKLANAMYMIRVYDSEGQLLKTDKLIKTGW